MARKRDTLCAGTCGKLIFSGKGCLPEGQAMCQPCRRERLKSECVICGRPTRSAKTCSGDCRTARMREVSALGIAAKGYATRPQPSCEICRRGYRRSYHGQRTCGRDCGVELKRRTVRVLPCTRCNQGFEYSPIGAYPSTCPECRDRSTTRRCLECQEIITVGMARICSDACRDERKRRYDRSYNATRPGAHSRLGETCATCAKPKPPRNRKFCNDCKAEGEREMKRRARRRRRARERNAKSEPYTLAEIAGRDRFKCGICRLRVLMDKAVPHPKAPTIDHILPLSSGGDDLKANVRLAHFICNSVRGDAGTVQLALIG